MSSSYRKIKYESEGDYGSVEEKYLYIHSHGTVDIYNVYNDNGKHLFSFSETGFDMGQRPNNQTTLDGMIMKLNMVIVP